MPWPSINPGELRHRVTIEYQAPASPLQCDEGGQVLIWVSLATGIPARIKTIHGKDVVWGGQNTSSIYLTVTIRNLPGVEANMRVVTESGSIYKIESIANIEERSVLMDLNCRGIEQNL